ncbi:glycoside hydrolase family 2 protein [Oceanobacillus senegalensis]|uniref:glycoside hydrolase family 2 protein n=1 Tax=Oceanobacillus senegalensis TaxID=1936063 RepID=UPI0015C474A5|nr:glycoside hydrolase family 2 TIM barrel-domain containing protein [Oceanobacillus senegalensis]
MYKRITILVVLLTALMTVSVVSAAGNNANNGNNGNNGKGTKTADDETGRIVENLDESWMFYKGAEGKGDNFSSVEFDDRNWEAVNLPHTWNAEDGADGGGDYYMGDGWYRKQLDIPHTYEGKELFLKFGAANKEAEVFVNGESVGTHVGGYTAFTVDITDAVNVGEENTIAVKVNNEVRDSIPQSGDFTFYGGIYRSVDLIVTDPTHIDVEDDGANGVYVSIPNDPSIEKKAEVSLKVPVKVSEEDLNRTSNAVEVRAKIKDADGKTRARTELKVDGKKLKSADITGNLAEFTGDMKVNKPRLWNGKEDPYLYTVEVTVTRKGQVIDKVTDEIGFRYFSVDPDEGFFLNGESYPLRGVDIHQDREGYGNAIPEEVREEDFEIIEEIGANTLRVAHYPHSEYVFDKADEMGLVVYTEIPFVNEMTTTENFADNTEQQLTEMIKQYYNHPSIVTWGVHNELGYRDYIPTESENLTEEEQYEIVTDLVKRLAKKAKELDPNRLVAQAIIQSRIDPNFDWGSDIAKNGGVDEVDKFIDISSMNLYYGWYSPKEATPALDDFLTNLGEKYPDAVLGISEYGAGGNPYQHAIVDEDFEWNGMEDTRGDWHPEEYQNFYHEKNYAIIEKHPELWATHVWNLFDFGSDGRDEGDNPGINDKGLVSYDRQLKKDSFYFYKAQWNQENPFVYITSRRYTERPDSITPVKVYSNQDEVTLTVNGVDYGVGEKQQNGVFVWEDVDLQQDDNVVVASAVTEDGKEVTDTVTEWTVAQ